MGKITNESYKKKSQHGQTLYEVSDDIIDDIANSQRIVMNRGKNSYEEEWENKKIMDFQNNFE